MSGAAQDIVKIHFSFFSVFIFSLQCINFEKNSCKECLEMLTFGNEDINFTQFSKEAVPSNSDEETISDIDENNVNMGSLFIPKAMKSQKGHLTNYESENNQDETSTWSTVHKETEELICLHDNVGNSSSRIVSLEAKKHSKGSKGKAKPKFSIHFLSHKGESSLPFIRKDENEKSHRVHQTQEGLEDLEDIVMEHSMTELLDDLQEENKKQSEVQVPANLSAIEHKDSKHSIAELLGGLQEKNEPTKRTSKLNFKTKGRRNQITRKRNMYCLGDRILDNDDPAEPMDGDTSSEDEAAKFLLDGNCQNQIRLATVETKGQTMADRFHEAFNATTVNDGGTHFTTFNHTNTGYYGRLQQVMQTEKEMNSEFLKQLQEMSKHGKFIFYFSFEFLKMLSVLKTSAVPRSIPWREIHIGTTIIRLCHFGFVPTSEDF